MRKKILAVAAATVMTMSMAIPAMAAAPTDYAGYYSFDDTLDNAATGGTAATLTGPKVTADATATEATFVAGSTGKAVTFTGAGSYGLKLGKLLTGNEYTISFMTQVHAGTFATPWVFIESMKGSTANEDWIAIQPVTELDKFDADAPRVWSMQNNTRFDTRAQFQHDAIKIDNWYNVTFVMTESVGTLYVNGEVVAKAHVQDPDAAEFNSATYGFPPNTVKEDTNVYLGVNYWDDVPLNGDIDELYFYNRALSQDELKELIGSDIKDTITLPELESTTPGETLKPELSDKNDDSLFDFDEEEESDSFNPTIIIIAAAVVVVVVIVVVVIVVTSKKKNAGFDFDDEE